MNDFGLSYKVIILELRANACDYWKKENTVDGAHDTAPCQNMETEKYQAGLFKKKNPNDESINFDVFIFSHMVAVD